MVTNNPDYVLNFPSFEDTVAKFLPSDDLLRDCFIANFLLTEDLHKHFIQSMDT